MGLVMLLLNGCAYHGRPEDYANPYGFFSGIWHGLIFILSLIGFLFTSDIYIMGEPNTGLFYYVGFAIGFMCMISQG